MVSALVSSCVRYSTLFFQREDVTCRLLDFLASVFAFERGSITDPGRRLPHPCNDLDDRRVGCDNHQHLPHSVATMVHEALSIKADQLDKRALVQGLQQRLLEAFSGSKRSLQ